MNSPRVSVIVPTFNRARYLRECLDSLLAQTVPAFEILVVDDGSEDETPQIAAQYGERLRYLRKENGGKSTAVNTGLAACTGSWIWLFDDDDVALPDAIERRVETLLQSPRGTNFVYSSHYYGTDGPEGRILCDKLYTPPHPEIEAFFLEVMKGCFLSLNSALVSRDCYLQLGGFDATFLRGQDYEFLIRLSRIARPVFCAAPSFIVRQHEGVRGTRASSHPASDRERVFRQFSAKIAQKIRLDVELGEFLVPKKTGTLDPAATRAALLNRIQVMASHGCMEGLFEDLRSVLHQKPETPLTGREASALSAAFRSGWAYDASAENWARFIDSCRTVKNLVGGRQALRAFAKALLVLAKSYPDTFDRRVLKLLRAIGVAAESFR